MRSRRVVQQALAWLLVLVLAWPAVMRAQEQGQETAAAQEYTYSQEQLDQLLAPIALYPDTLLSQILMASTYPLEVVEANRWLKQNPDLKGDRLDDALKEKPWDVSIKSLCHFPNLLSMMDQKLQETTDLGNAFLAQQDQVMDTIQKLRARAREQGNLNSTNQQRVVVQDREITIEPVEPEVVYVPAYDPCRVYGPWWYPACSPLWFWWPDIVLGVGFFWWPPFLVGPLDGWCGFYWHRHSIFVNVNKTAFVHRLSPTRMHGGVENWVHSPGHRRGVAYPNAATSQRFGRSGLPGVDARRNFRGFAPEGRGLAAPGRGLGGVERPGIEPRGGPSARPLEGGPGGRGFEQPRGVEQPRAVPGSRSFEQPRGGFGGQAPSQPRSGGAFQGFGSGGVQSQFNSERGRQSMGMGRSFQGGSLGGPSRWGGFGGGAPRGGGFGGGGGAPRGGGSGGGGGGHRGR